MKRMAQLIAVMAAVQPAMAADAADLQRRQRQALAYIANEQDRWTTRTVLYDDRDSGGQMFFPTNWAGDFHGLTFDSGFTDSRVAGTTCIKITFRPSGKVKEQWASISWVYPDIPGHNWGDVPGRDLRGASRLSGWIAGAGEVKLRIGGINWPPDGDPRKPHKDGFSVSRRKLLSNRWEPFELLIPAQAARDNVIGGFSLLFESGKATVYLDELAYDRADKQARRLIRSYTPSAAKSDDAIRNAAFVYDNAVCLLAFLAAASSKDESPESAGDYRRRARLLAASLCWAQANDRCYQDGRWRNGYAPGPLEDYATRTVRLPGIWDDANQRVDEDGYVVSSDTGNICWTICALLTAHEVLESGKKDSKFLDAAKTAADWVDNHCRVNGPLGGYSGGYEGRDPDKKSPLGPKKITWQSTEHNLDYYVCCEKLARLTPDAELWRERAQHARRFVFKMWQGRFFWTGTRDQTGKINQTAVPSDAQTWAVLALAHDAEFRRVIGWSDRSRPPACLAWVENECRRDGDGAAGYRFSDKGEGGCWSEGAAHLAACYHYLGDATRARRILDEIAAGNPVVARAPGTARQASGDDVPGGIKAAFPRDAFTGFWKDFGGPKPEKWVFKSRYHTGAAAWFALAASGRNPYWLTGIPGAEREGKHER